MNIIMDKMYMVVLGTIRIWRMFMYIIAYIGFKPIKAYAIKKLNAGGIGVDGKEPSDMMVHNDWVYHRMVYDGTLGLAEAYIDEWWDCGKLDEYFTKIYQGNFYQQLMFPWDRITHHLMFNAFNLQSIERSYECALKHYDLGTEFFQSFLDKSMTYTCGYWKDAKNLEEAQQHKMELIGRKLKLKPGMRVLDLGCGWGALCKYLAETYNVQMVGVTNSREGAKEAEERCKGLPIEIRCQDYREVDDSFDRIVSICFFEHVGRKNYRSFFQLANRWLSDDGILLLQCTGHDNDSVPQTELFLDKYIFPNSMLPNHKNIPESIDNIFCIEDWQNFGQYYDKTLTAWHDNFVKNWSTISHMFENPKKAYRMFTYYFSMCAGLFRARKTQLWQIVLTKGIPEGYISVR